MLIPVEIVSADGCVPFAIPEETGCCAPPLCGSDLCATFCAFMNILPSGPLWDYWKQAAISYFQHSDDPSQCPLLKDPACPSLVLHAIYCVLKLRSYVHNALWPAIRESNPATAITTLDYHLARLGWEDCYRQHCRSVLLGELTPYEIMGECGPVFCDPSFPPELECAVKRGVAVALTRANMGVIKNLCGMNWVLSSLGAEIKPVYNPTSDNPCDVLCSETPEFTLCHTQDWLPSCGSGDACDVNKPPQKVQAYWEWGCDKPAGSVDVIWPGVLAAECIIRSMLPDGCTKITRCC